MMSAVTSSVGVQLSQVAVLAAVKGRTANPRVRAWTFTMDGHDYYVLHLGTVETLIYDTHSKEWYVWGSGLGDLWRAYVGLNWLGGTQNATGYGSNVIVGDDGNGALYFLDPEADKDDDALTGATRTFTRVLEGQVVVKSGYDFPPCFGVQVYGSIGKNDENESVTLEISDDRGVTYVSVGDLTVVAGDVDFRLNWQSLGSMRAPGRLVRITDYGALRRIDGMEMEVMDSDA
jgi:hypothetical protein